MCTDPSNPICIVTEFVPGGSLILMLPNITLTESLILGMLKDSTGGYAAGMFTLSAGLVCSIIILLVLGKVMAGFLLILKNLKVV